MLFSKEQLNQYSIVDYSYTEDLEAKSYKHYEKWVSSGNHGHLGYLADHRKELRENISNVYPESQSAFVFLFSYESMVTELKKVRKEKSYNGFNIASYALAYEGDDYHVVLKAYLESLGDIVKKDHPEIEINISLDVHPILERDLAHKSGLGFFGKNSMLISPEYGSYFLIGSLILNKKIAGIKEREIVVDHCGTCRACVEACPTKAIDEETRTLFADQCISTYTIENFKEDAVVPTHMEKASGEIFGCDICQDVCPWNKRRDRLGLSLMYKTSDFFNDKISYFLLRSREEVVNDLKALSNRAFKRDFANTAFARTGKIGILKNILFWMK